MSRLSPRVAFIGITVLALLLLVYRARPLARLAGTVEPLLYVSGLAEPRSLIVLPDDALLVGLGGGRGAVRVLVDRQLVPASAQEAALLPPVAAPWEDQSLVNVPLGRTPGPGGRVYATIFATAPGRAGSGSVVRLSDAGTPETLFEALNFPVALAFAPNGQLYVLEFSRSFNARDGRYAPNTGRLLAVGPAATRRRAVVRELNYPTAVAFARAGDAFFTENGAYQAPAENGNVLHVPAQGLSSQS